MRFAVLFLLACAGLPFSANAQADGPTDAKAQKTYKEAIDYLNQRRTDAALESFKKANKQDGGHCQSCLSRIVRLAVQLRDWKSAEAAAQDIVADAQGDKNTALAHYQLGIVLEDEAMDKHKDDLLSRAHDEFTKALTAVARFPDALFADGKVLAHLYQDDAAKTQFQKFVDMKAADDPRRQRALRYISESRTGQGANGAGIRHYHSRWPEGHA